MNILVMMLFVSLGLAFSFLAAFIWASRNRQFDDVESPAWRALFDEAKLVKQEELKNVDK